MNRHTIRVLALVVLVLWAAGAAAQEILLDEKVKAGNLECYRDFKDPKKYYYLPDKPSLARHPNGKPQFSLLKFVKNVPKEGEGGITEAQGGGWCHFLVTYEVSDEDKSEAEQELARLVPGAKLVGPITYRAGNYVVDSFKPSEGGAATPGKIEMVHAIHAIGKAPLHEGHKCSVSMDLTKEGATTLWESFEMTTSVVSVMFEMEYKGYRNPFEATITADWSQISKHHQLQAGVKAAWFGADIDLLFQDLVKNGAITIEQKGEDENMEKIVAEAQRLLMQQMFDRQDMPSLTSLTQAGAGGSYSNLDRAVKFMKDEEARRRSQPSGTRSGLPPTGPPFVEWPVEIAAGPPESGLAMALPTGTDSDHDTTTPTISAADREKARAAFERGRTHYDAGRYRQALTEFQRSNTIHSQPQTRYNIGQCQVQLSQWQQALPHFQACLQDTGQMNRTPDVPLCVAECLIELNRAADAVSHIQSYLRRADREDLSGETEDRRWANELLQECRDAGVTIPTGGGTDAPTTTTGGDAGTGGGPASDLMPSPFGPSEPRRPTASDLERPGERSPAAVERDRLRSPYPETRAGGTTTGTSGTSGTSRTTTPRREEQQFSSGVSLIASYKMRKIKVSGKTVINLKKYTLDSQPARFTGNIGGLRRYLNDPDVFRAFNLDDPVFKQREVLVSLDGQDADDFTKFINYVTVQIRKKHGNGDMTYDELKVDRTNFDKSANNFRMVYGWKGDDNRAEWIKFDYRVRWSFFGGATFEQPWRTTDDYMISISPPTQYRTIRFEADPDELRDLNVRHVDATMHYTLFGKPLSQQVTLRARDEAPEKEIEYVCLDGDFNYEYELSWRLRGNKRVTTDRLKTNETIIYCDELPEE